MLSLMSADNSPEEETIELPNPDANYSIPSPYISATSRNFGIQLGFNCIIGILLIGITLQF